MAKSVTLTVRGIKLRTATQRRFVLVAVRPEDVHGVERIDHSYTQYCRVSDRCLCSEPVSLETRPCVYVKFAEVCKRSDSPSTLSLQRSRMLRAGHNGVGTELVIIDTVTGEEV